jgi:hypothetical protein
MPASLLVASKIGEGAASAIHRLAADAMFIAEMGRRNPSVGTATIAPLLLLARVKRSAN